MIFLLSPFHARVLLPFMSSDDKQEVTSMFSSLPRSVSYHIVPFRLSRRLPKSHADIGRELTTPAHLGQDLLEKYLHNDCGAQVAHSQARREPFSAVMAHAAEQSLSSACPLPRLADGMSRLERRLKEFRALARVSKDDFERAWAEEAIRLVEDSPSRA